jgi:DNA mismatch endonuclease (patch repair protein)
VLGIVDTVSPEQRSEIMRHGMGYRYRLHKGSLPGSPDLVFGPRRKVIFVHGCWFHDHGCRASRHPKTNAEYWAKRFKRNRERDAENLRELTEAGRSAFVAWECQLRDLPRLADAIRSFLDAVSLGHLDVRGQRAPPSSRAN